MPIYNTEQYVDAAIESLIKSFEHVKNQRNDIDCYLIIRNDGSIDNSRKVIQNKIKKYNNIFLFDNDKNIGILETRRELFLDAHNFIKEKKIMNEKDIYLSFFDSDDICVETRVLKQLIEFEKDSSLIGCGGQLLLFKDDPSNLYESFGVLVDYKKSYEQVKVDSLFQSCSTSGSMSFRYEWIKKRLLNLERSKWWSDVKIGEDWGAIVDFIAEKDFKFKNIDDVVLLYRRHEKAMTNLITDGVNTDQAKIRNKALSYINLELTKEEHLLHISISPCRYWEICNVDFFQMHQKNIYEMGQKLMAKIITANNETNFYDKDYLDMYISKVMKNIKYYQSMNLKGVKTLLKLVN